MAVLRQSQRRVHAPKYRDRCDRARFSPHRRRPAGAGGAPHVVGSPDQPRYLIAASYTHSAPNSSALTGTRSSAAWIVGEELKSGGMLSGRKPYVRIPKRAKCPASVPPLTRDAPAPHPQPPPLPIHAKRP